MDFKEHKVKKLLLSPEMAEHKIKLWCAYQERSHNETRQKLYDLGQQKDDVELIISKLIEENYLNEERFALALAGGKFRIKHWGKIKIKIELRRHKVSDYSITKALNSRASKSFKLSKNPLVPPKTNNNCCSVFNGE